MTFVKPITALQQFHRWCINQGQKYHKVGMNVETAKKLEKLIPRIEKNALDHVLDFITHEDMYLREFYNREFYRDELIRRITAFRDRRD